MSVEIHGINLAQNSDIENFVVEELTELPTDLTNFAVNRFFIYNKHLYMVVDNNGTKELIYYYNSTDEVGGGNSYTEPIFIYESTESLQVHDIAHNLNSKYLEILYYQNLPDGKLVNMLAETIIVDENNIKVTLTEARSITVIIKAYFKETV